MGKIYKVFFAIYFLAFVTFTIVILNSNESPNAKIVKQLDGKMLEKLMKEGLQSLLPRSEGEITLVTQCTVDRFPQLETQAKIWDGIISAAVYVPSKKSLLDMGGGLVDFFQKIEQLRKCRLDLTIYIENRTEEVEEYPINLLRNIALRKAATRWVFLVDVDFIPSEGIYEKLMSMDTSEYSPMSAFVVPAFELLESAPLPKTKAQVKQLYLEQKAVPFHSLTYTVGHNMTNYDKWFSADEPYRINYMFGYEPYIVAPLETVPKYDERFSGYGMNKVSHLYEVYKKGFSFVVLPDVFITAAPHPVSSWSKKHDKKKVYRKFIQFKREIDLKYKKSKNVKEYKPESTKPVVPNHYTIAPTTEPVHFQTQDKQTRATKKPKNIIFPQ